MPQLNVLTYTSQLFWLFISLGILFVYLWKFFIPKMFSKLSEREEKVKKILSLTQQLDSQANKMIEEHDQKLRNLKQGQKEKLQNVATFIQTSRESLESDLKKDLDAALTQYTLTLQESKKQLLQELPKSLSQSLVCFMEKNFSFKPSDDREIERLLDQEMKKLHNND